MKGVFSCEIEPTSRRQNVCGENFRNFEFAKNFDVDDSGKQIFAKIFSEK